MNFGLVRRQLGQDAPEPQRVLAERRAHPVVTRGRRVALVEDQVDDFEHRRQPCRQLRAARNLEWNLFVGQRALGADDSLGDRRLGDEEGTGNLVGREAAEETQRERDAGLGRKHGMAGDEDEAEQVVPDLVVQRVVDRQDVAELLLLEGMAELFVLTLEKLAAPEVIDRAVLRGCHEPCARVARDSRLRPLLQRRHERILREVFGQPDVAHDARQRRDELRRFDLPDRGNA